MTLSERCRLLGRKEIGLSNAEIARWQSANNQGFRCVRGGILA